MARKSIIVRAERAPKYKSRVVRRCFKCGRKHGYMRDFDMCRICFREAAHEGHIPGIKKSSW
jgi:small subunit ribosomal protein S14